MVPFSFLPFHKTHISTRVGTESESKGIKLQSGLSRAVIPLCQTAAARRILILIGNSRELLRLFLLYPFVARPALPFADAEILSLVNYGDGGSNHPYSLHSGHSALPLLTLQGRANAGRAPSHRQFHLQAATNVNMRADIEVNERDFKRIPAAEQSLQCGHTDACLHAQLHRGSPFPFIPRVSRSARRFGVEIPGDTAGHAEEHHCAQKGGACEKIDSARLSHASQHPHAPSESVSFW